MFSVIIVEIEPSFSDDVYN